MCFRSLSINSFFVLVIVSCGSISARDIEHPLYLGVIEPYRSGTGSNEVPAQPAVRMAFVHQSGIWQPMPNQARNEAELDHLATRYPRSVHWVIAFDGKFRGEFNATRPLRWDHYSDVGVFHSDPKSHIDLVTKGWRDFRYWGGPQHFRPMVVVSTSNFRDPDDWKPWTPTSLELARFYPAFRVAAGTMSFTCNYYDPDKPEHLKAETYPNKRIVLVKAYRSKQGYRLVALKIDPNAIHGPCHGNNEILSANWPHWTEQWLLDKGNGPEFLGRSLELIDAGDYDGNGYSEIVFHKYGYNHDAYVLLFDHLSKQIEFGWVYH